MPHRSSLLHRGRLILLRRPKKLTIILIVIAALFLSIQLVQIFNTNSDYAKGLKTFHNEQTNNGPSGKIDEKEREMLEHEEIRNRLYQAKKAPELAAEAEKNSPSSPSDNNNIQEVDNHGSPLRKYKLGEAGQADDDDPAEEDHNVPLDKFLQQVLRVLITGKPKTGFELTVPSLEKPDNKYKLYPRKYGSNGVVNIAAHDNRPGVPILSEEFLGQCLTMPSEIFQDLQTSHFYVTKWLPQEYPEDVYKGEGIVMVGGGRFSWFVLIAVENLRSTGSKLPVEVLIPSEDEYEEYLCEELLPSLNAKCVILTRRLPFLKKFTSILGGYQYKSLALLSSSFEKVLMLDADNLAVENPDPLFNSDPFKSYGMILWPDYWKRVTHPDFYKLATFHLGSKRVRYIQDDLTPPKLYTTGEEDPVKDVPLHDREGAIPDLTTESGQIMVNKRNHMRSLLLSLYYNLYGPHQYYPLFSQGTAGEGDKETFLAAATYYKEPVYRVKKICDTLGYWMEDPHKFIGVGMIQHDPVIDYKNTREYQKYVEGRIKDSKDLQGLWESISEDPEHSFNSFIDKDQKPRFYHCNFPKLDPVDLKNRNKLVDENGKEERLYTSNELDFDFEMKQWLIMRKYFCDGDLDLKYYTDNDVKTTEYCDFIDERIEFLKSN
ncbi:DEKNAAC105221 [Brettanomyces naardenensis]|uniref:DEKNAAC105221 n=1 Tax=Brettanomyces naardenensis TaxID=13370 RepID=A0A448YT38_BRENA|nr:DEKNAAC105221 [Brettanomyces naardenensis]